MPAARHKRKRQHKDEADPDGDTWFGWCLIALFDLVTLIPIAIQIVQIQEQEEPHLLTLPGQAQQNLGEHSRIRMLMIATATAYRLWVQGQTEAAPVAPVHLARVTPPLLPAEPPAAQPRLTKALLR